jgi:CRISPR-associated protein Cas5h
MMLGFKFRLEGLYFTTFRKPTSTSLIASYSIPPYTTIRGLISNALGLKRDDLSVQDWIKIGIKPIKFLNKSTEMAKILKLKGTGATYKRVFPSSPMFKEFLISPSYDIYVAGDDKRIKQIHDAMLCPNRPLYIGTSDDLVDIQPSKPVEPKEVKTKEVYGIIGGIHEKCFIEKVPYKFIKKGKDFSLEYKTVSVPKNGIAILLKEETECWRFEGENIWLT